MLYKSTNVHGGDVYSDADVMDFSANTNPYKTPEKVKEAVIKSLDIIDRYPDPYCRELKKAISENQKLPEDYILCGNGAAELIYSYIRAVKAEHIMELAPTFSEYSIATDANTRIDRYILSKDEDFVVDEGILYFIEEKRPQVFFLCNPNNPTGRLINNKLLGEIISLCKQKNIRLFLDECFLDLTKNGVSAVENLEKNSHISILKAFTKSYGMAGLRLGYILSSDEKLLSAMAREVQPWNISTPAQKAGVVALREKDFLQKTVETVEQERDYLTKNLKDIGITVYPSDTNFILFFAKENLGEKLLQRGIKIRDCSNYVGLEKGWYRIAVRLNKENQRLINEIKDIYKGD